MVPASAPTPCAPLPPILACCSTGTHIRINTLLPCAVPPCRHRHTFISFLTHHKKNVKKKNFEQTLPPSKACCFVWRITLVCVYKTTPSPPTLHIHICRINKAAACRLWLNFHVSHIFRGISIVWVATASFLLDVVANRENCHLSNKHRISCASHSTVLLLLMLFTIFICGLRVRLRLVCLINLTRV